MGQGLKPCNSTKYLFFFGSVFRNFFCHVENDLHGCLEKKWREYTRCSAVTSAAIPGFRQSVTMAGSSRRPRDTPYVMSCLKPGDEFSVSGRSVRAEAPKGRRSRLFELGVLFTPPLNGLNFMCCVPVVNDPETGSMKRCGALLKIPKGSLGNPFRHLRQKHKDAYASIVSDTSAARGAAKRRDLGAEDLIVDRAAAEVEAIEGQFPGGGAGGGRRTGGGRVAGLSIAAKAGITLCAKHLLPLGALNSKDFKSFAACISPSRRPVSEALDGDLTLLYAELGRQAVEVLGGMRRRIAACRDSIYSGVPFLCVVVDPEFVPYPVLTIRYVGEANRIAVESFVTSSEELAALCLNAEDTAAFAKSVEATVRSVVGDDLGTSFWDNVALLAVRSPKKGLVGCVAYPQRGRPAGWDELQAMVRLLGGRSRVGDERSTAVGALKDLVSSLPRQEGEEGGLESLSRELETFASMFAPHGTVIEAGALWGEAGATEMRLPTLRKIALSVRPVAQLVEGVEQGLGAAPQTPKDVRTIEEGDFLEEGYRDDQTLVRNTLLVKYNEGPNRF